MSTGPNVTFIAKSSSSLHGECRVPGDKSISHRAILLGSIAIGRTVVEDALMGADNRATVSAMQQLGVDIQQQDANTIVVNGVGLEGLRAPTNSLDLANSGTGMRLLSGILAAQNFASELCGDKSLSRRPMGRIVNPLQKMGADVTMSAAGTPPLHFNPVTELHGIEYVLPIPSAQIKSCLLLAGLYAKGKTTIIENAPSRDHTERMLQTFSYPLTCANGQVSIEGGHLLQATTIQVPADISSAAFFMVAASVIPGSDILLKNVGINPTRTGVLQILRQMGADISLQNEHELGAEPVADIRVKYSELQGITMSSELVPLAIDEFPVLFVAAAVARGKTVLRDARELRVKESDRLAVMAEGLQHIGGQVELLDDGITIEGGKLHGGEVASQSDHRIAMAFAVAGAVAAEPITIQDCANVVTSFPDFIPLAQSLGLNVKEVN